MARRGTYFRDQPERHPATGCGRHIWLAGVAARHRPAARAAARLARQPVPLDLPAAGHAHRPALHDPVARAVRRCCPACFGTKILDPINVAVALTVYTVALLVRVVADGAVVRVRRARMAAASAMGYTTRQRLFTVQLPIAVPVIGAGLRVAAVSNVSLVSVASIIGVPQLGPAVHRRQPNQSRSRRSCSA